MKKYLALLTLLTFATAFIACGDTPATNSDDGALENPNDTPTEAYKRLFAAVKSKNTESIRNEMSEATQAFAGFVGKQQNKTIEEVYANGFSQTTFAETLPEIRDERIKGKMAAVEVWNAKANAWEDLPFVRERSGWKLAIGDAFRGSWTSPGKGRDAREKEAANVISGNNMINGAANAKSNANSRPVPIIRPDANIPLRTNSNLNK
jgi:hypothetical protein